MLPVRPRRPPGGLPRGLFGLAALAALAAGCNGSFLPGFGANNPDEEVDAELLVQEEPAESGVRESSSPIGAGSAGLSLNLRVGERFPLLKTVVSTLVQPGSDGAVQSRTELELLIHITVEEVVKTGERAGQTRMSVQYHRVRYLQEMGGRILEFDSRKPASRLPPALQAYRGLVGNRFDFWLGPDHQIVDVPDFDKFIDRCLEPVDPVQRNRVRTLLAAYSGSDGIANFVDDGIGLLPPTDVKLGDSWTNERRLGQPLPMHVARRYTLHNLTAESAEVAIVGTISPMATASSPVVKASHATPADVQIMVRGGRALGECVIDRRSGLPVQSRVEERIEMTVTPPDGPPFDQQKYTLTTLRSFPPSEGAPLQAASPRSDRRNDDAQDRFGERPDSSRPQDRP
jgi:hypothetical protein